LREYKLKEKDSIGLKKCVFWLERKRMKERQREGKREKEGSERERER